MAPTETQTLSHWDTDKQMEMANQWRWKRLWLSLLLLSLSLSSLPLWSVLWPSPLYKKKSPFSTVHNPGSWLGENEDNKTTSGGMNQSYQYLYALLNLYTWLSRANIKWDRKPAGLQSFVSSSHFCQSPDIIFAPFVHSSKNGDPAISKWDHLGKYMKIVCYKENI